MELPTLKQAERHVLKLPEDMGKVHDVHVLEIRAIGTVLARAPTRRTVRISQAIVFTGRLGSPITSTPQAV
jgi:hypothetical protein